MTKKIVKRTDANNETLYFYTHSDAVDVGEGSSTKSLTEVLDDTLHKSAQTLTNAEKTQVHANLGTESFVGDRAVRYDEAQVLGSSEKTQALANLGLNGVDDVPTENSNNMVKSGGVHNELALGAVYDVSAKNPTAGPNNDGKWESLSALLSDANLNTFIPTAVRKGGMSIKFVQSSDNKYVQARLMAQNFTTDVTQWQGVDDEPTHGSKNIVESGGVYNNIGNPKYYRQNDSITNEYDKGIQDLFIDANLYPVYRLSLTAYDGRILMWVKETEASQYEIKYQMYFTSPNFINNKINLLKINGQNVGYIIYSDTSKFRNNLFNGYKEVNLVYVNNRHMHPYADVLPKDIITSDNLSNGCVTNDKLAQNSVDTNNVIDGSITDGKIQNNSLTGSKFVDRAIGAEKLGICETVYGKNKLNPSEFHTNRWIGSNGQLEFVTGEYGYYDYLPIKPDTAYHISNANDRALSNRIDCYIAFYDSNKEFISPAIASNVTDFTTPQEAAYVRISVVVARCNQAMLEEGDERTEYVQYISPEEKIIQSFIIIPKDSINTDNINDGAITQEKFANSVLLPAKPASFRGFTSTEEALQPNETLNGVLLYITKDTLFEAEIIGTIEDVECGIEGYYKGVVEITPTELIVKKRQENPVTFTHGLTLGQRTIALIQKDNELNATIKIFNEFGDSFSQVITWPTLVGRSFVKNNNTSVEIGATINFMPRDINEDIWMFGDSYFDYESNTRWPYCMLNWGYKKWLAAARPGENAGEGLVDFQTLLSTGKRPSYAVWCHGMNGGRDTNGAVNPNWLTYTQQFIALCETYGITPILSTIPTVPTEIHVKLNEWVRASGYRYIDFANAVENGVNYYWKGWGSANALLSSDEIHPSLRGGIILATQVLTDFCEITIV